MYLAQKIIQGKLLVALLFTGATMLLSCGGDIPRIDNIAEMPAEETDSLHITYSSNGKIRYLITTPKVLSHKEAVKPYDEFPQGGYVELFNDSLQLETTILTKYAIHHILPNDIWMATDSVVVHNLIKGQSLYTDTLYWDLNRQEIYTDSYVKVVTPDMVMPGEHGMRSDQQFRDYEFRTVRNSELFYDNSRFKGKDTTSAQE
jgi:hypothetical protein